MSNRGPRDLGSDPCAKAAREGEGTLRHANGCGRTRGRLDPHQQRVVIYCFFTAFLLMIGTEFIRCVRM